jgi:hypothetical protein
MPSSSCSLLPPPVGHDSWLEYALATLDVRSVVLDAAIDGDLSIHREDVLAAAWAELNALRKLAGLPSIGPKGMESAL